MTFWITVWKASLIGALAVFAVVAVVVAVGGARDVVRLLQRLRENKPTR